MYDRDAFEALIRERGLWKRAIADKIGMPYYTFARRLKGDSEFRASEIEAISKALNLKVSERNAIFFKD